MLTRTLATLTLLLAVSTGPEPKPSSAAHPSQPRHARVVDDVEGCRVPPPSPEPAIVASCTDQGRP